MRPFARSPTMRPTTLSLSGSILGLPSTTPCDRLTASAALVRSGVSRRVEEAGVQALHAIGDGVAPRLLTDAIFDGHRLAREIDSDTASVPLAYLREEATV